MEAMTILSRSDPYQMAPRNTPYLLRRSRFGREKYRLNKRSRSNSHTRSQKTKCWTVLVFGVLTVAIVYTTYLMLAPNSISLSGSGNGSSWSRATYIFHEGTRTEDPTTSARQKTRDGTASRFRDNARISPAIRAPSAADLCLGMAIGVSASQLVTFAASFRESSPQAELILFLEEPMKDKLKEITDRYGASVVGIEHGQLQPAFLRHLDVSLVRWVLIQRLLDYIGTQYNHVLMMDVGDTFFQANPFDIIGDPGIYVFMENRDVGESETASNWIEDCLGPSVMSKVANEPFIHSGVALGTTYSAMEFARRISEAVLSQDEEKCKTTEGLSAVGIENYFLYTTNGVPGDVFCFNQISGPMVDVEGGNFLLSESGVENLDERKAPIVRRYEGSPDIKALVFERYVYWDEDDEDDPEAEAMGIAGGEFSVETACSKYTLGEDVDQFRAKCDLITVRVQSIWECCVACNETKFCEAFSYDKKPGLCYTKNCRKPDSGGGSPARGVTSGIKVS